MKAIRKLLCTLMLCTLVTPALAETPSATEGMVGYARSLLTEVIGYTHEDAQAFEVDVEKTSTGWRVSFWHPEHPEWVYETLYDQSGEVLSSTSPFGGSDFIYFGGEAVVRDALYAGEAWFSSWNDESRAALDAWLESWSETIRTRLARGLSTSELTAAQAIQGLFEGNYGPEFTWTEALVQWRDAALAAYGLEREALPEGPGEYVYETAHTGYRRRVNVFLRESPAELAPVLADPNLEGYECLCGAYVTAASDSVLQSLSGLMALEKDGQRLLVAFGREMETDLWTVIPVGYEAVRQEGELYITYDPQSHAFQIVYPTAVGSERFCVSLNAGMIEGSPACRLISFQAENAAAREGVIIGREADGSWYHVTTWKGGVGTEESISAAVPGYLDYIDASAFPTSAEECCAAGGYAIPEGYGISSEVRLRERTSTRSASLGEYKQGTLVEVLEELPGDPYPWYHVRIGHMEGYMCSLYVDYPGSVSGMGLLKQPPALPIAQARRDVELKEGTGWFSRVTAYAPEGTAMHVLAERDGWLHVMIPNGEIGYLMDVDGVSGYVKKSEVTIKANTLSLEWAE